MILSIVSVGLGMFSVWQASESSKQAGKIAGSIQALKQQQEALVVTLKSVDGINVDSANKIGGEWEPDNVTS